LAANYKKDFAKPPQKVKRIKESLGLSDMLRPQVKVCECSLKFTCIKVIGAGKRTTEGLLTKLRAFASPGL